MTTSSDTFAPESYPLLNMHCICCLTKQPPANWRTGKHEGNNLLRLVLTIKAYRIASEYYCPSAKANPLTSKGGIRVMMPNNCGQGTRTNSFLVFSAFLHVNIWFCYCPEKNSFKHFFPFFFFRHRRKFFLRTSIFCGFWTAIVQQSFGALSSGCKFEFHIMSFSVYEVNYSNELY